MPSINKLLKYPLLLSHRDKDQRTLAANSVQNRLHLYIPPLSITRDRQRSEIFLGPRRASLSVALIILNFVTTSTNISELTTERIFFDQNHAET